MNIQLQHAATLLHTVSAFGEEAPDFEEAGVETFVCGEVHEIQNTDFPEPSTGTIQALQVTIDGQLYSVLAFPIA